MTVAKRIGRINVWPDSTTARSVADAENMAIGVMTVASTSAAARAHQHPGGGASNYELREDGSIELREDGGKELRE